MIFVFRRIIYDSALIHEYDTSAGDCVTDLQIMNFSPDSFKLPLTAEFAQYNYVYIPHFGRYYYMDVSGYKGKNVEYDFNCDYGRTFGDVIAADFYIADDSMGYAQLAHLPTGGHIMTDENVLYVPRKESAHKLNRNDAEKVITLLSSGIIINFEDFTPETYIPPAPPVIDSDNGERVILNQSQG